MLFIYLTNEVEFGQDFYNIVYQHIIYMCDFLVNLNDFFAVVCTGFHEGSGFHKIRSLQRYIPCCYFRLLMCQCADLALPQNIPQLIFSGLHLHLFTIHLH